MKQKTQNCFGRLGSDFNSVFPCIARPWNALPMEYFPFTYDLSCFKSRINRHHFVLLFLNSMPCSGCPVLHGVNPN